jgi:hypothetical protein
MSGAGKKGSKTIGTRVQQQPDGTTRKSQVVTTFGPGSMVDLLHDAVLVGGLDFWQYDKSFAIPNIDEPRLRDAIVERFKDKGRDLSKENPFRAPPAGNDREPTRYAGIDVLEFPQWFVCQNASCRSLQRKDGLELKNHRYWHQCSRTVKGECVPVRFVEACTKGHVSEFRWIQLVHEVHGNPRCAAPQLTFDEGSSGDFNEIRIACACGSSEKLVSVENMKLPCRGERPWLGPQGHDECDKSVRLLVRTASNSYFPQVVSAISIPDPAGELEARVREVWDFVKGATKDDLPIFRRIEKVRSALEGYGDELVLEAIAAIHEDQPIDQGPLRTAEYKQFVAAQAEQPGDLPPLDEYFFARRATPKGGLPDGIGRLVVVPKLREVVAQIGFTRLEPVTPDVQGEYDLNVEIAALSLTQNWLPATEMRGEGVFIELDLAAVRAWEERPEVIERGKQLMAGYDEWAKGTTEPPPFPGIRFYMLHSLSHLLMSAISLECGYAASAIRERIYAGPSSRDETPMAGILLSTGTTGSEGTLGGLVEQGRRIREHLQGAWDLGRLCSNDPVCGSHSPEEDHAERYLEGAACHGCLFVAECSCERFNRYLDRALVVPTLGHEASVAFFSKRP